MGYSAHRVEIWQRERQITDALETLAIIVRAVTAQAGIALADLDRGCAPESWRLRQGGRDQRWRGTLSAVVIELTA